MEINGALFFTVMFSLGYKNVGLTVIYNNIFDISGTKILGIHMLSEY